MMLWPSCFESCSNTTRGATSVKLPAANGTIAVSVLVDQVSALALNDMNARPSADANIKGDECMTSLRSNIALSAPTDHDIFRRRGPERPIHSGSRCRCRSGIGNNMNLRHARTFAAVAELGTVSKAAQRLRIAQPALSRQISSFEHELGLKLFDRVGSRLVLTSE